MDKRARSLRTNLAAQARLNVATGLARMPLISANTIRAFNRAGIGPTRIKLVGTNALYAYEAMAAGYFETGLVSTQDIDLLLNHRAPLRIIASDDVPEETLISVLRSADRSFEITRQPFRASNRNGFLVDIMKPERNPPWAKEHFEPAQNDIQPSPITGLVWLENAQSIEQSVIDAKGMPVMLCVPDPRVFAIHKYWLSQQLDRGPLKARRDRMWLATSAQVANWWRERDRVTVKLETSPTALLLTATVKGTTPLQQPVTIWVNLPVSGSNLRALPGDQATLAVKTSTVDRWRSAIVLTGLTPGSHSWQLHFDPSATKDNR